MTDKLVAAAIVALPMMLAAWLALRRQPRPILWFTLACIVVGTGYLSSTGATDDIARLLIPARDASAPAAGAEAQPPAGKPRPVEAMPQPSY